MPFTLRPNEILLDAGSAGHATDALCGIGIKQFMQSDLVFARLMVNGLICIRDGLVQVSGIFSFTKKKETIEFLPERSERIFFLKRKDYFSFN